MKKRTVVLYTAAVALVIAVWLCLLPRAKKIDKVVQATEYSLADPDYRVAHTVTIQGYDTRNLLGKGKFEGTLAVSGIDTGAFQTAHITFPVSASLYNVSYAEPHGYHETKELFFLMTDRDWENFAGLLMECEKSDDRLTGTFGVHDGRFLVSGTFSREEALTLAEDLARDNALEVIDP